MGTPAPIASVSSIDIRYPHKEAEQSFEANFIGKHFNRTTCTKYKLVLGRPSTCRCGLGKESHTFHTNGYRESQNPDVADVMPTNAFGVVVFEDNEKQKAPYVRLHENSEMEDVLTLLIHCWRLKRPMIIISVIGGAQRDQYPPDDEQSYKRIILDAVLSTDAWLITGGTKNGVMDLVGKAIYEHKQNCFDEHVNIVALGIATWGVILEKDHLVGKDTNAWYNSTWSSGSYSSRIEPDIEVDKSKNLVSLEPNHSHFLLVDDGTFDTFGGEIMFRSKLEQYLTSKNHQTERASFTSQKNCNTAAQKSARAGIETSIIYFVVGGDENTLITFFEAIKNNAPVIVFKGSRGLADIIESCTFDERTDLETILRRARNAFPSANLTSLTVPETNPTIRIFNPKTDNIHSTILDTLIEANNDNMKFKLYLALTCKQERRFCELLTTHCEQNDVVELMLLSLATDNSEFLLHFDKAKMKIEDVMKTNIGRLYLKVLQTRSEPVDELLYKRLNWEKINNTQNHDSNTICLEQVGKLFAKLLDDDKYNPYSTLSTEDADINLSLFYFGILMNRPNVGKMFWTRVRDPIAAALVACVIMSKVAKIVQVEAEADLSAIMLDHAQTYQDNACALLSECHKRSMSMSHHLLVQPLEKPLQNHTLLSISESNNLMKFMGHTCCQTKLNAMWRGHMALHTEWWKIWLSVILPFCIFLIQFKTGPNKDVADNNANRSKYEMKKPLNKTLYNVRPIGNSQRQTVGFLFAMRKFYAAPYVIFVLNIIAYIVFLGFFAYFVIVELNESITKNEVGLWIWILTIFSDEIRQLRSEKKSNLWETVYYWLSTKWNSADLLMFILFVTSVVVRSCLSGKGFLYARAVYSITVAVFYMRLMQFFYVSRNIGPKIIMIKKMLFDLVFFLPILFVFMVSVGILYQANLYPNAQLSWELVSIPYRQIYGDIEFEYLEGEAPSSCANNGSSLIYDNVTLRCLERNWMVPIFGAVYLLLTNILLVNLLIAMFSYTFQSVQANSNEVWQFYRYSIVQEYSRKPFLPPPGNIFAIMFRVFCRYVCHREQDQNAYKHSKVNNKKLTNLLKLSMDAHLKNSTVP